MKRRVYRWGEAGPALLCLHCALAHGRAWADMAKPLAARGMRVLAPDLVGHGTAPDWDQTRDLHDQATEDASRYLGDRPALVIGHSFGATIALRLAIEQPTRILALVLIEPVLFAAAGKGAPGRLQTDAAVGPIAPLLDKGEATTAARRFTANWGSGEFDDLPEHLQTYMKARLPLIVAQEPALERDRANLLPRLEQVKIPVLLIEGATSPPVIPEIMAALAAGLPDARRRVVDGAGHMAPITHPDSVAGMVLDFLPAVGPQFTVG